MTFAFHTPDSVEVVVEAEETNHVHGLRKARLVDIDDRIGPLGEEHLNQLVSARRRVLEPVPAARGSLGRLLVSNSAPISKSFDGFVTPENCPASLDFSLAHLQRPLCPKATLLS